MFTNQITLGGGLYSHPERVVTSKGTPITEFRLICSRRTRDAAGNWTDAPATGVNCKAFKQLADHIAESSTRGDRLLVTGQMVTESWEDRAGKTQYRDVLWVDEAALSLRNHNARSARHDVIEAVPALVNGPEDSPAEYRQPTHDEVEWPATEASAEPAWGSWTQQPTA